MTVIYRQNTRDWHDSANATICSKTKTTSRRTNVIGSPCGDGNRSLHGSRTLVKGRWRRHWFPPTRSHWRRRCQPSAFTLTPFMPSCHTRHH